MVNYNNDDNLLLLLTIVRCFIFLFIMKTTIIHGRLEIGEGSLKCHSLGITQQTSVRPWLCVMRSACNEIDCKGSAFSRRQLLIRLRKATTVSTISQNAVIH
jgi:hypothetical protein